MKNFVIILLDGVGVGELPDAANYGDVGSNTLANIAKALNGLSLPNLQKLGLGNITDIVGIPKIEYPLASYGKMNEKSQGKDSVSGHWEISGLELDFDFPYYPNGFPNEIIEKFLKLTGFNGILGNIAASGTEIIMKLGDEHVKTGFPIVYTSADSVFQIAAHEQVIPLKRLYEICEISREKIFINDNNIGRIIARPFVGTTGNYNRTTNRKDYAISPPDETILDLLKKNSFETIAIGKINDLFNHRGITQPVKTKSNKEGIDKIINSLKDNSNSFIFANLVDFDVYFGHRNDVKGFADALKMFDDKLPEILSVIDDSDVLVITADHGNDPTTPSTDHSREFIPLLYYQKGKSGINLGIRNTFADIGKTAADYFAIENNLKGTTFLQ
ncbi:MAG: phosphopentomutase [Bacteroidetes bacterium]|nr:phosphopentomutase [Bacteroidota bacterium]MBU1116082.1 phosphopentomutase [Bacteroidota bacterium]MBU1799150.1 phosphopentomutase [Bacteroidota bacterium]